MLGMLAGMIIGAALVALLAGGTIASGGLLAAAIVGGAVAGGGLAGEKIAQGISTIMHISGIVTGNILMPTSSDVNIGYLPAARAKIDGGPCNGLFAVNHFPMPMSLIAQGSDSVNINYLPAARVGDKLVCAADIQKGEDTVIIGGGTKTVLPIFDTEAIMHNILVAVGLLSAVVGLGALAIGVVTGAVCVSTAIGGLAVAGATMLASQAAQKIGDMIGPGWGDVFSGVTDFAGIAVGLRVMAGEPVDVVTGEVCVKALDFELPGNLPIRLERAYASSLNQESWLGPNWCFTWGQSVIDTGAGVVHYVPGDGRRIPFDLNRVDQYGWVRNPTVDKVRLRSVERGFEVSNEQNHRLRFEYLRGKEWLLSSIEDQNGNTIRFHYDDEGALRGVMHTGGYRLHVDGSATRITSIALEQSDGSLSVLVRYEYDAAGCLSGIDNGSGKLLQYEYNESARITRWADRESTWYEYNYDKHGRAVEAIGPGGMYHYQFIYDPVGRATTAIDSYSAVTLFRYNHQGRVVEQRDPLGGVTLTEWDDRGNKLSEIDPESRRVEYIYDAEGNLIARSDGLARATRFDYNPAGLPVVLVDAAGKRWLRKYDSRNNLIEAGLEGTAPWRYERDESGNLIRVIDPSGLSRQFTYNKAGLPLTVSDWAGNVSRYQRDEFGRVVSETDPLDSQTSFVYNRLNRLAGVTLPDGAQLEWEYDLEGNLSRRIGPDGSAYSYERGAFDLLRTVTRPTGSRLHFHHDHEGRLTDVENESGEHWSYQHDLAGRVIAEQDFTGRIQKYEYDRSGLCVERTNGRGQAITIEYDKAGQLIRKKSPDGFTDFDYDVRGLIIAATNDYVSVEFSRDDYGRVTQDRQGNHAVESWYDERGLKTRRRTTSGNELEWVYDANRHVSRVELPGDQWLAFSRDAVGRDVERRMRGGFLLRQQYDPADRLTSQWAGLEAGASRSAMAVAERQYSYDPNGNPDQISDPQWGASRYSYDRDGRIERAIREDGRSEEFRYDPSGNITEAAIRLSHPDRGERLAARIQTRFLSKGGRLQQDGKRRYFYDEDGQVTERHDEGRVWRYTWSAEGRLRSVITPSGDTWTYDYDAFGRRVRKKGPRATTIYVWDGAVVAEELHQSNSGLKTAGWVFEQDTFRPVAKIEGEKTYACVTDQVGTPRELVSADGRLAWSADLTVWGSVAELRGGESDCAIRFQGQWYDEETGLCYNWNRYYEPETGRYISPDPIGIFGGTLPYGYVHNPLWWVDPYGLGGDPATSTHIHYVGVDQATGKPYSGYASMPGVHSGEEVLSYRYSGDFSRFQTRPDVVYEGYGSDAKAIARGLEQRDFEKFGGLDGTANKQSPVGPRNARADDYLKAADEFKAEQSKGASAVCKG
jgi:RHS repeat-associated protein